MNTGKLAGRTLFVTGGSRGIGKAIALKAAQDGANVVIAAKTTEPHPKLPGTIFTAAEEIEKAGGKCLPVKVDVQSEQEVQEAVESTVKRFGGLDILINNASAISLTGTLQTPMKRYDLMNGINARGTYLVSQKCIPYLKKGKNPHILNISPPLNMSARWFKNHVAYTMAKYGMSMCVLGMSEELKDDGIAVNALWPRTAIWTAAMEMLGGDEVSKKCRTPDIMADAAYMMLCRDSKSYTGNFAIDDGVLKELAGISDFSKYAVKPGEPLMPDFFLDEFDDAAMDLNTASGGGGSEKQKSASSGGAASVEGMFDVIKPMIDAEMVGSMKACYAFNLSGSEEGTWYLNLRDGSGSAGKDAPDKAADVTFSMDSGDFIKMFKGELKPANAFFAGKMKMDGPMNLALKLDKLLSKAAAKL